MSKIEFTGSEVLTAHLPAVEVKKDVYWVGSVHEDIRSFHGYETRDGTSYNAYFIKDEFPTVIDSVKREFAGEFIERIKSVCPLSEIKYVISNHAEYDHASAIPILMKNLDPEVPIVTNKKGQDALVRNYPSLADCKFLILKPKETLTIGKRTLSFLATPLVHWPESQFTYSEYDEILFSMDVFGQHIASGKRFDDEYGWERVKESAIEYYANIVACYRLQTARALKLTAKLGKIDMICCAHGLIIRSHVDEMIKLYQSFTDGSIYRPKVTVVYDTFYHSTEAMARAIQEGAQSIGAEVMRIKASVGGTTQVARHCFDSKATAWGSPTLNSGMHTEVAGVLHYAKGLKILEKKPSVSFGSYGWTPGGTKVMVQELESCKSDVIETIDCNWRPTEEILKRCFDAGIKLGKLALGQELKDEE
ncbi:A-type flavoprotein lateral transfer candidate [Aduncisulcus paluster]|uniref:A-type flavoprotein lateral transfer candidate n=1 Tax=Aduncisulcus paluster TaxID=2918883 RepID=A0ABQ5KS30_9EUKA|nr:A-type flavoprotein lateral transfer candidate [Aduncisulcus paluster]|eukprot:gnl/Carplike_NY0171/162_a237_4606.p1 GENE.gnl/Carplike_NY0171/162_a237_4606~~gnl/Carplike_NY0171/162_a237_4606.p1  ORF type:complete len:420 (-),score=98.38 gnl/Carplike_NY0171/162_a237_4606:40-1299(-)